MSSVELWHKHKNHVTNTTGTHEYTGSSLTHNVEITGPRVDVDEQRERPKLNGSRASICYG